MSVWDLGQSIKHYVPNGSSMCCFHVVFDTMWPLDQLSHSDGESIGAYLCKQCHSDNSQGDDGSGNVSNEAQSTWRYAGFWNFLEC